MESLSAAQARRIALAAQGFSGRRTVGRAGGAGRVDRRHLRGVVDRLGLLQIDSVNVLQRAHYVPAFSRLGPYPTATLDRLAWRDHELFEYWAHEASLLPVRLWPHCRWRMERRRGTGAWGRAVALRRERPGYIEAVLAQVRERGPVAVRDLVDPGKGGGAWWGWSDGKVALEELFASGEVTVAERVNFERRYDVPERVLPKAVVDAPDVPEAEARREMLRTAAAALGVATASDLYDYFRLKPVPTAPRLAELVDSGELVPVAVEGWGRPAYLWQGAAFPARMSARALLSPFDSLIFARQRVERLFGFRYRIEIYVPAPQRVHGYYVLPLLLGDRLVARVDLKADRQSGRLVVQSAHAEPRAPSHTAEALAAELALLAEWLGLGHVHVTGLGDLGAGLAATCRARRPALPAGASTPASTAFAARGRRSR